MTQFSFDDAEGYFDLTRCVTSGQVFRWETKADGSWFGVDGDRWYLVRGNEVETNGDAHDFQSLFRLDWDAREIENEILRRGSELAPAFGALRGLRVMRSRDPVETFFSFLCTPNNNIRRIAGLVRYLSTKGTLFDEVAGGPVYRFPRTEEIAGLDRQDLRSHGFGYRADTIPTAAKAVLERGGDDWIESLKSLPYEEAHAKLIEIPYIGRKLADCIGLFALDHSRAVPIDTHVWQAAVRIYFPEWSGTALTDLKYRQFGTFMRDRFGDVAGWAHQYLFIENLVRGRGQNTPGKSSK